MMTNSQKNAATVLTVAVIAIVTFFGAASIFDQEKPQQTRETASTDKTYMNDAGNFSIMYPNRFSIIEETVGRTTFKDESTGGLDGFAITFESTAFATTKEWLDAQPEGSDKAAGIAPTLWINEAGSDQLVAAEYLVVDMDGAVPVYGKYAKLFMVRNGMLYTLHYGNQQLTAAAIPEMSEEALAIFASITTSGKE